MFYPTDKKHCKMNITTTIRSEKQKKQANKFM